MKGELKMDVNDYLPLRDVVFNTLRQAILRGEMEPGADAPKTTGSEMDLDIMVDE